MDQLLILDQSDPRKFSTEFANFLTKMGDIFGDAFMAIIISLILIGIILLILLYSWNYRRNHRAPLLEDYAVMKVKLKK